MKEKVGEDCITLLSKTSTGHAGEIAPPKVSWAEDSARCMGNAREMAVEIEAHPQDARGVCIITRTNRIVPLDREWLATIFRLGIPIATKIFSRDAKKLSPRRVSAQTSEKFSRSDGEDSRTRTARLYRLPARGILWLLAA